MWRPECRPRRPYSTTYSLSPRTLDEMVAVGILLGRQAESALPMLSCALSMLNIEHNLYLVSQVMDLGLPMVIVLNMADVAAGRGIEIDERAAMQRLGFPVVKTEAHRKRGIDELRNMILAAAAETSAKKARPNVFPPVFAVECDLLDKRLQQLGYSHTPYYLLERLLLDVGGYLESHLLQNGQSGTLTEHLAAARGRLAEQGCRVPAVEARARYEWVRQVVEGIVRKPASRRIMPSDKLDSFLTHRIAGLAFFVGLMFVVFQAIFTWSQPLMELCKTGQEWIGSRVAAVLAPGPLQSLVVDGVIAGVGSVLIFLPQITILFLFIAVLEDCGYMAGGVHRRPPDDPRAGLSGKSFVPLMSSFACASSRELWPRIRHREPSRPDDDDSGESS